MERASRTDNRGDDLVKSVSGRFDAVDRRFDRVEGDIKELRSLIWWLWATTIFTVLVVLVTVLRRT